MSASASSSENHHSSQFDEFLKPYYSNFNSNYQSEIAYWQSQARALEYKNYKLQEYIKKLLDKDYRKSKRERKSSLSNKCRPGKRERKKILKKKQLQERSCEQITSSAEGSEISSCLSEEMVEFLEQNVKYRLERDKEKEMIVIVDEEWPPELPTEQQTENLFGSVAPQITAMENAVQITYDHMCEQEKPVKWPAC